MEDLKIAPPKEHLEFLNALGDVFKNFPGMNKIYAIDSKGLKSAGMANGCCKYCVDDEGNTYCCESSPDCNA